jgi:hypothetical protein
MAAIQIKVSHRMACPFFMPTERLQDGGWLHPSRLPLGGGWSGHCCAAGHEGATPTSDEVRELCNLGYAVNCPRLPKDRVVDALRFSVVRDRGAQLTVMFVYELGHRPAGKGTLEYDLSQKRWISFHPDARTQKMAECYVESYLLRRARPSDAEPSSSQVHE